METGRSIDGRYRVRSKLGENTYLAENIATGVRWVFKKADSMDAGTSSLLRHVRHPALPRIFEYLMIDGTQYSVTEYIEGVPLLELCMRQGGRIDFHRACSYMGAIAGVVHFLHTATGRPILHLDIKPGNIVISDSGIPCLIDFGCMRLQDGSAAGDPGESAKRGSAVTAFGTPGYLPPELLAGGVPSPASDIYMIGMTLFRIIADVGGPMLSVPPLRELASHLPAALASVIGKCTMSDPADRYRGADELARDLADLAASMTEEYACFHGKKNALVLKDSPPAPDIPLVHPEPSCAAGRTMPDPAGKKKGKSARKILCVWGNGSFACEFAHVLGSLDRMVILIDADLLSPSADLLADVLRTDRTGSPGRSEGCSLSELMEEYAGNRLSCESIDAFSDRTGSENVRCICGMYRMEDYEYYSTAGLSAMIRLASQCSDFVIVACNKFIYDEFTCLSLLHADLILVPLTANHISFREYHRYVKFLSGRRQIDPDKLAYVGFEYQPHEDFSAGTCDKICEGRYAGAISYSSRRRMLAGGDKAYAASIEPKILKQYQAVIRNLHLFRGI